jgi:transposase
MKPEKFKNYYLGTNSLFFPEYEFVIKLSYPRVFVRYKRSSGYYTDLEKFFQNVAEVQYLEGKKPPKSEERQILNDIWNFITMEKSTNQDDYVEGDNR